MSNKFTNNFSNSLMLISEFSGANRAFQGFLSFNPFNVIFPNLPFFQLSEFMMKLDQGLSLQPSEKAELMRQAYSYV